MTLKPPADPNTPLPLGLILQTLRQGNGYDVNADGIPNVANAGNLDYEFSTGAIVSDNTSSKNRFVVSSYVFNDRSQPCVALFGMGKGNHVWGSNLVGYTAAASDTAIGVEVDYGNVGGMTTTVSGAQTLPLATLNVVSTTGAASTGIVVASSRFWRYTGVTPTSFTGLTLESGTASGTIADGAGVTASVGGTATGVLIVAEGGNVGGSPAGPYIQLQSNTASQATTGIKFNGASQPAVMKTGSLIKAAAEIATIGVDFAGSQFSTAAAWLPLNTGSVTSGTALIMNANGGFANGGSFMDIRAAASSSGANGILFRLSGGNQPVTSALITTSAGITATTGINLSNGTFTTGLAMGDNNISVGTTTGMKIGTATSQKIGFYNAAPVALQTGVAVTAAGVHAALVNLGLITA